MTAAKKIKHELVERDLKVSDLARRLGTSYANIAQKLKRDNFSESELREIAEALNCDLKIEFVERDGASGTK